MPSKKGSKKNNKAKPQGEYEMVVRAEISLTPSKLNAAILAAFDLNHLASIEFYYSLVIMGCRNDDGGREINYSLVFMDKDLKLGPIIDERIMDNATREELLDAETAPRRWFLDPVERHIFNFKGRSNMETVSAIIEKWKIETI